MKHPEWFEAQLLELLCMQDHVTHFNEKGPAFTADALHAISDRDRIRKQIMDQIHELYAECGSSHPLR